MNYDDYAPREDYRESDLFKKAEEIRILIERITTVEAEDGAPLDEYQKDWFGRSQHYLLENSSIICAKIAGAYGAQLYDIKMQNASVIRKAAMEIITDARGLQINGYKETEYLDVLREEVDAFRVLFAEWIKTFDKQDYIIDRWGLFNPPGVHYDDHDPDDDIPFDPEERMRMMNEFMNNEEDEEGEEWKKGTKDEDADEDADEDQ